LYLLLLMVVTMFKHMAKIVIKILKGSTVTQTDSGGLTIYPKVANFLQCTYVKIMKIDIRQSLQKVTPSLSPSG